MTATLTTSPPATASSAQTLLEWMGIRLRVPEDWYLLRHGLTATRGTLALADRRTQRMQLWWQDCDRAPDLDRTARDYRDQLRLAANDQAPSQPADIATVDPATGWHGCFRTTDDGRRLVRAARYWPNHQRVIEVTLTPPPPLPARGSNAPEDPQTLIARHLSGIVPVARGSEATRWRLHGLDVQTPPGWRITAARLMPTCTELRYEFGEDIGRWGPHREAVIRRIALADGWFDGELEPVLRREARGVRVRPRRLAHRGYGLLSNEACEAGPRLKRWTGRLRRRQDLLWHDVSGNAVLHVTTLGPRRRPVAMRSFRVNGVQEEVMP